jgi:2-polyprenyl-3-methyl-5-hydroxy-6-metoxy-1,4-benzoquinol methylase
MDPAATAMLRSPVMPPSTPVRHGGLPRQEMVPFIPRDASTVLDVGCSRGRFGATLQKEIPALRLFGIEPDPVAAQEASDHYEQVTCGFFPNDLPAGGSFDCIVFNDVLEHVVDPWTMLARAQEHLAPGGHVVASIPNVRHYIVVRNLLLRGRWDYADWGVLDRTHLRFFTRASIEELFDSADMEIETLAPINPIGVRRAALLVGPFRDMKYTQFAVVARPRSTVPSA